MTFGSLMVGAGLGMGVQMYSNAFRKVPLSRFPWLYAMNIGVGAYLGHKVPQWELALVQDINQKRSARGLGPLVGTTGWFKYQLPDDDMESFFKPTK